jgi:DNA-binding transcriptional MocR family regulator
MKSIAMDEDGTSIRFDHLIEQLEADKVQPPQPFPPLDDGLSPIRAFHGKHLYRYVMYLVPTYSNPTGTTMKQPARERLVKIAREYDMLLITDDVYDFLGFDGKQPLKRLVTIDKEMGVKINSKGHTISNCSFSKLLGPGARCGWVESATPILANEMGESGANHSGGAPCQFTSTLIENMLQTPATGGGTVVDEVIRNISAVYAERAELMRELLLQHLPEGTRVNGGRGGYFVWVRLPDGYSAKQIVNLAHKRGLILGGGYGFEVPNNRTEDRNVRDWGARYFRLSYAYLEVDQIKEGILRLVDIINEWTRSNS